MLSKFQWKPFWLATQLYDWTGWQYGVDDEVFAPAPLPTWKIIAVILKNLWKNLSSNAPHDSPADQDHCALLVSTQRNGGVRITSRYPNFNERYFGLPSSEIHRMTGLPPKIA